MNYYEHHIGDYAEATAHLSLLEDGVYSRMLRKYYATEKPLPAGIEKVQRLLGAKTPEEISAVSAVLADFFTLETDGWHQERCDQVIAEYHAGEPDRIAKKLNEETRSDRHRLERRRLFEVLNDAGQHAAWNIGIKDLRALVQQHCGANAVKNAAKHSSEPKPVTPQASQELPLLISEATAPVTAPATPATEPPTPVTATQSPSPNNQYPLPRVKDLLCTESQSDLDAAGHGPPVMLLMLANKTQHAVTQADVDSWAPAYPGVNIPLALERMRVWCDANPTKRKTKRGITAFITKWLDKDQNESAGRGQPARPQSRAGRMSGGFDLENYEGLQHGPVTA